MYSRACRMSHRQRVVHTRDTMQGIVIDCVCKITVSGIWYYTHMANGSDVILLHSGHLRYIPPDAENGIRPETRRHYHGCRCLGSLRHQVICTHGIDIGRQRVLSSAVEHFNCLNHLKMIMVHLHYVLYVYHPFVIKQSIWENTKPNAPVWTRHLLWNRIFCNWCEMVIFSCLYELCYIYIRWNT